MKSVGEAMAIGRTFQESLQKAMRSLEIGSYGFEPQLEGLSGEARSQRLMQALRVPKADRIWYIGQAFREGLTVEQVHEATGIEPWFLAEIEDLMATEARVAETNVNSLSADEVFQWKRKGFSDVRLSQLLDVSEDEFREKRHSLEVRPVYKRVDSCAAEFATATAYMYSSYDQECEAEPDEKSKIMVLGGGPNRIGQGHRIRLLLCSCSHGA